MKGADRAHGVWVALSVSACRFCCGRGQENLGAKVQKKLGLLRSHSLILSFLTLYHGQLGGNCWLICQISNSGFRFSYFVFRFSLFRVRVCDFGLRFAGFFIGRCEFGRHLCGRVQALRAPAFQL